jgi:aminoglycoside phosphotransferase (APT) family kinase protein
VAGRLLEECIAFLAALHTVGAGTSVDRRLRQQADTVTAVCSAADGIAVERLADTLVAALGSLPLGFAHGDFFHGNLLVEDGRLVGVVDWDSAGPGRLPLLDLLHFLQASASRDLGDLDWGPRFVRYLLPLTRAGGDDTIHSYAKRIGLVCGSDVLEGLALAYWLDYVDYQLRAHPHRAEQPRWLAANVHAVIQAIPSG